MKYTINFAALPCDICGKTTNTFGSWDTTLTIICADCAKNRDKYFKY